MYENIKKDWEENCINDLYKITKTNKEHKYCRCMKCFNQNGNILIKIIFIFYCVLETIFEFWLSFLHLEQPYPL